MGSIEKLLTPVGECKWAHIQEPKPGFTDKDDPKYCINMVFDPKDKEWAAWAKGIKARAEATGGANPVKWEMVKDPDHEGKKIKSGLLTAMFHTSVKHKPGLFDHRGVPMGNETLVGNGSFVRLNYTPAPYTGFGGGVTLYLNAVQVMDLVEFGNNTAASYGFEVDAAAVAEAAPFDEEPPLRAPTDADLADQDDSEQLPY